MPGPVGIHAISRKHDGKLEPITLPNGNKAQNRVKTRRVLDEGIANTIGTILQGVVKNGTAQRAQLGDVPVAGKTGTTENYGDAWFVGWTPEYTVAVWVGYPKKFQPMKTEFQGEPVAGGTYPAGIWKTFMESVLRIDPPPKPKEATRPRASSRARPPPRAPPRRRRRPRPRRRSPRRPRRRRAAAAETQRPPQPEEPAPQEPSDIPPAEQPPDGARGRHRRDDAAVRRDGSARERHRLGPAGHGRDTEREPAAQNRHGSSAALVIPMRGPTSSSGDSQPGAAARSRSARRAGREPLRSSSMSSAWVSLPGPEQRSSGRSRPRRARISRPPRAARARGSAPRRRRPRPRRPR